MGGGASSRLGRHTYMGGGALSRLGRHLGEGQGLSHQAARLLLLLLAVSPRVVGGPGRNHARRWVAAGGGCRWWVQVVGAGGRLT